MRTRLSVPLVLAALVLLVAACAACGDGDAAQDVAVIELRVWQSVGDPEELHATSRLAGSDWGGTVALAVDGRSPGYAAAAVHHYSDLEVGGVGLRIWQRAVEPERIFVRACASTCRERFPIEVWEFSRWRPLGMTPLPLADGSSPDGRYRYGDISIAVPRRNPELLEERERLLALRDVLEGGGTELDWNVATPTASWEGVTLGGVPPRVAGLDLSERGLNGEIWGYLGDLAELTELQLDGNRLTGLIPSKLALLSKLTRVSLGGNHLSGCIPPPLLRTASHDLDTLGLPECPPPARRPGLGEEPASLVTSGTYREGLLGGLPRVVVLDVPDGASLLVASIGSGLSVNYPHDYRFESIFDNRNLVGIVFRDPAAVDAVWLYLDGGDGWERERSPYSGCVYDCGPGGSAAALIEQVAASVWTHELLGDAASDWWVWP